MLALYFSTLRISSASPGSPGSPVYPHRRICSARHIEVRKYRQPQPRRLGGVAEGAVLQRHQYLPVLLRDRAHPGGSNELTVGALQTYAIGGNTATLLHKPVVLVLRRCNVYPKTQLRQLAQHGLGERQRPG